MSATIILVIVNVLISWICFSNASLFQRLAHRPWLVDHSKQYDRWITSGFVHANWLHLGINMFVLWSFGRIVFAGYTEHFENKDWLFFLLLYIGGIMFSVLYDFRKHRHDPGYNAVGASGAVSAVVFASIILHPASGIYLFFIPLEIPSPIFGILYLVYSAYMARRGRDNIGHSAHFWGAVFGVAFTIALKPTLFLLFLDELKYIF